LKKPQLNGEIRLSDLLIIQNEKFDLIKVDKLFTLSLFLAKKLLRRLGELLKIKVIKILYYLFVERLYLV
jgi:hypothetical protein